MSEFSIIPPCRRKGRCPTCDSIIQAVLTIHAMADTLIRCDKCDTHVLPVWDKPVEPKTYTPTYHVAYEPIDPDKEREALEICRKAGFFR